MQWRQCEQYAMYMCSYWLQGGGAAATRPSSGTVTLAGYRLEEVAGAETGNEDGDGGRGRGTRTGTGDGDGDGEIGRAHV